MTEHLIQPRPQILRGREFDLTIGYQAVNFTGKQRLATAVNGTVPAPILGWREGERVTLRVTNTLSHVSALSYRATDYGNTVLQHHSVADNRLSRC